MTDPSLDQLATALGVAFAAKDLQLFGALLAADARWGDDDNPNCCRTRDDVVATFGRLLVEGVEGTVTETHVGPRGVALHLRVDWPEPGEGRRADLWQSYLVANGRIVEIQGHDDGRSAIRSVSG
jgi:hypothetical protein